MIERGPGRPAFGAYETLAGERVPSVTTVLSRWKDTKALMPWAAGQGGLAVWREIQNGRDLTEDEARRLGQDGPESIKNRAAEIGASAHDMIEDAIHRAVAGQNVADAFADPRTDVDEELARNAFNAWLRWYETIADEYDVLATEVPLVHEKWKFGGTFDALARHRAERWLECWDWKSSSGIYVDYVYQMGGYSLLIEQEYGEAPKFARIVQVHKHTLGRIEPCGQGWLASLIVGSKLRSYESPDRDRAESWLTRQVAWAGTPNVRGISDEPDGKHDGHLTLARKQFQDLRRALWREERIKASLRLN